MHLCLGWKRWVGQTLVAETSDAPDLLIPPRRFKYPVDKVNIVYKMNLVDLGGV